MSDENLLNRGKEKRNNHRRKRHYLVQKTLHIPLNFLDYLDYPMIFLIIIFASYNGLLVTCSPRLITVTFVSFEQPVHEASGSNSKLLMIAVMVVMILMVIVMMSMILMVIYIKILLHLSPCEAVR